jgi:hypothetical protein
MTIIIHTICKFPLRKYIILNQLVPCRPFLVWPSFQVLSQSERCTTRPSGPATQTSMNPCMNWLAHVHIKMQSRSAPSNLLTPRNCDVPSPNVCTRLRRTGTDGAGSGGSFGAATGTEGRTSAVPFTWTARSRDSILK